MRRLLSRALGSVLSAVAAEGRLQQKKEMIHPVKCICMPSLWLRDFGCLGSRCCSCAFSMCIKCRLALQGQPATAHLGQHPRQRADHRVTRNFKLAHRLIQSTQADKLNWGPGGRTRLTVKSPANRQPPRPASELRKAALHTPTGRTSATCRVRGCGSSRWTCARCWRRWRRSAPLPLGALCVRVT